MRRYYLISKKRCDTHDTSEKLFLNWCYTSVEAKYLPWRRKDMIIFLLVDHRAPKSDKSPSKRQTWFIWSELVFIPSPDSPELIAEFVEWRQSRKFFFKARFWQMVWSTFEIIYLALNGLVKKHGYSHEERAGSLICQRQGSRKSEKWVGSAKRSLLFCWVTIRNNQTQSNSSWCL